MGLHPTKWIHGIAHWFRSFMERSFKLNGGLIFYNEKIEDCERTGLHNETDVNTCTQMMNNLWNLHVEENSHGMSNSHTELHSFISRFE